MEQWKVIESSPNYFVSNFGRVKNKKGKLLKQFDNNGYMKVHLYANGKSIYFRVHRLVAKAFIGNCDGFDIDHIDSCRNNNNALNLRIVTSRQNQHARILKSQKLEDLIDEIYLCFKQGHSLVETKRIIYRI